MSISRFALRCCLDDSFHIFTEQQSLPIQAIGTSCHRADVLRMARMPLLDGESRGVERREASSAITTSWTPQPRSRLLHITCTI